MQSLSLELIDDCHIYISGDVIVHPSAAIAPGVLLQADPGCRLIVAAGVCIGQGSVLHAHQGWLEVDAGVTIGSGVLIVGQGKIGANACIGALTTVINSSVEPNQLVPANSLLGETGRQVALEQAASTPTPAPTSAAPPVEVPEATKTAETKSSEKPESLEKAGSELPAQKALTQVYGQAYVERIMITMFPHRRSLNNSPEPPP